MGSRTEQTLNFVCDIHKKKDRNLVEMETQFYTCQVVKTLINATEKVDPDLEKDQECVHGRRIRRVQIVSSCKVMTGRLP